MYGGCLGTGISRSKVPEAGPPQTCSVRGWLRGQTLEKLCRPILGHEDLGSPARGFHEEWSAYKASLLTHLAQCLVLPLPWGPHLAISWATMLALCLSFLSVDNNALPLSDIMWSPVC